MTPEQDHCSTKASPTSVKLTVAVLMTGNIWSLPYFREVTMPSLQRNFWCPGYDGFLVTSDRVYMKAPAEYIDEGLLWNASFSNAFISVQLISWEENKLPKEKAAKRCDHFKPTRTNHVGLLQQFLKWPVAYAAMRNAEEARGHSYDYVVRLRPDFKVVEALPHIKHIFHQFRRVNKNTSSYSRYDFGGPEGYNTSDSIVSDVVIWDDQFAVMPRYAARSFFTLAPQAFMVCHPAEIWEQACGLETIQAVHNMRAKRIPCTPIRTIAPLGRKIIRDCGSVLADRCFGRTVLNAWGHEHQMARPSDFF